MNLLLWHRPLFQNLRRTKWRWIILRVRWIKAAGWVFDLFGMDRFSPTCSLWIFSSSFYLLTLIFHLIFFLNLLIVEIDIWILSIIRGPLNFFCLLNSFWFDCFLLNFWLSFLYFHLAVSMLDYISQ